MTNRGSHDRTSDRPHGIDASGEVVAEQYDLVADVRIEGVELLARSLEQASALTVALDYETGVDGDTTLFIWASGAGVDKFEAALSRDDTIESLRHVATMATRRVYRLRPAVDCPLLPSNLAWLDGRVTEHRLAQPSWQLRVRFPNREGIAAFNGFCRDRGLHPYVAHLAIATSEHDTDSPGLTGHQDTLLRAAYERGYFESPREVSQEELATEFDTSSSTVSHRIRRATMDLLERELW